MMKINKNDAIYVQVGKSYKKVGLTINPFKMLLIYHKELGLSKTELKRLLEQGGISLKYYKSDE